MNEARFLHVHLNNFASADVLRVFVASGLEMVSRRARDELC